MKYVTWVGLLNAEQNAVVVYTGVKYVTWVCLLNAEQNAVVATGDNTFNNALMLVGRLGALTSWPRVVA